MAVGPASALAASPLVDDTFAGGTPDSSTWVVDRSVRLKPTGLSTSFDALPAALSATPWEPSGGATTDSSSLTVDDALVSSAAMGPNGVLEWRGKFGPDEHEHVGFASDLNAGPWAIISTSSSAPAATPSLYARTYNPATATVTDQPIAGLTDPFAVHTFRIEWGSTDVKFFVDDALKATAMNVITQTMQVVASDGVLGGTSLRLDWLGAGTYPVSGTYASRVFDAGDARAVWGTLTRTGSATGVTITTRTGNTATPDSAWSDPEALGAGGAIRSPMGRYIQYEAKLTSDGTTMPSLESVAMAYAIDDVAPAVSAAGVAVSGTTATATFASAAPDLDRFECKLDSGAFTGCTSPKAFAGLGEGSHTVTVHAIDHAGNVGADVAKGFSVDTVAPAVSGLSVQVAGTSAGVTFSSAAADLARFECSLDGAGFVACVSPKTFSGLAAGAHTVRVRAVDTTGNRGGEVAKAFTITKPATGGGVLDDDVDKLAPTIGVGARTLRASRKGVVKLKLTCPGGETNCTITVKLVYAGKTLAKRIVTLAGGRSSNVTLKLSKANRKKLAKRHSLKAKALITALDAAGNKSTRTVKITLRAPAR